MYCFYLVSEPCGHTVYGNEMADQLAKQALQNEEVYYRIPASDLKPLIRAHIHAEWQAEWDQGGNKLHQIQPFLSTPSLPLAGRRDDMVYTRLKIGHTYLTHKYLLAGEPQPMCHSCNAPLTVRHILLECFDFMHIRSQFYTAPDLKSLFTHVKPESVLNFTKAAGLFYYL